jgi:restriction system protein
MTEQNIVPGVWVVKGGDNNELANRIKKEGHVAINWPLGDASGMRTRDSIKKALEEVEPESASPISVGQVFRFVNEIGVGDYILTPERALRVIHVSRCSGPYRYDPSVFVSGYPHVRPVEYVAAIPRSQFPQTVRNTLGSLLAVFRADIALPFLQELLAGHKRRDRDDSEVPWADEIESQARGQILEALDDIDHYDFQMFVAGVLQTLGYKTRVGQKGKDGGVDIIAHPDVFGLGSPRVKVQTKNKKTIAGIQDIGYLNGVLGDGERGLFVCTGGFSKDAENAPFVSNGWVVLVDGRRLLEIILEHYEESPAVVKHMLPLRRVYVPEKSGL